MQRLLTIVWILMPLIAAGQSVNFEDGFSDGSFTADPAWSGDIGTFRIEELGDNKVLRLNGPQAGSSYLSTPSVNSSGVWEFFIRIDGTAPSGSNKATVFLMSDQADLSGAVSGYALRIGESGDDLFRIVRFDSGTESTIVLSDTTFFRSGGSYRIKVARNSLGNWTMAVGKGYDGELIDSGNIGIDNTYTSTSYFGLKVDYTSSRTDDFYFDFKIDIPPVTVSTVTIHGETELDLGFSRPIDLASVNTTDFTVYPGDNNPQAFTQLSADSIRLAFANNLTSGPIQLKVTDIEDQIGETSVADTTLFFIKYDLFQPGDVVINEFMKDPPTGTEEYIELKNTSNRYLNLQNWQLGDKNSLSTLSSSNFALLPDSFVVITSDSSVLNAYYGNAYYLDVSLPAFNNGEDQIRVFDNTGALIDSLQYDTAWGGVDVALERRDVLVSSIFSENWGDSPTPLLGTPGRQNLISLDNTPPHILSVEVPNDQTILVALSERLKMASAETLSNYELRLDPNPGITPPDLPAIISIAQIAPDTLQFSLNSPLKEYPGKWTLMAENLTDIFGNSSDDQITFNYYVIYTAEPKQVAINEFMYDPPDGFSEFIELYNPTDSSFNLQNWTLNDSSGEDAPVTYTSYVLASGSYVVLAPDSTLTEIEPNVSLIDMGSRFSSLNNSSDAIILRNQNGALIDSLTYTSDWGGEEISLERRTPRVSGIYRENWANSSSVALATPGQPNAVEEDLTPPAVDSILILNDREVQILFSERILLGMASKISNYELLVPEDISTVPAISDIAFLPPDTVHLIFASALPRQQTGTQYQLLMRDQTDIFGNVGSEISASFFMIDISTADSSDVLINEFLFDPGDDQTEFIELYNRSSKNVDLSEWTLNDNTGNRKVLSDESVHFTAGSYLILTADSTLKLRYPARNVMVLENRFSSLNNSSDAIVLRNQHGLLLDSLTYQSNWGGNEVSLERRSAAAPSIYKENWGSSPAADSSTPGLANQIEADLDSPQIGDFFLLSSTSLRIVFNERVDSAAALDPENYTLSPSLGIRENKDFSGDSLTLDLQSPLSDGTSYTLTISNQYDIFGNFSASLGVNFEYTYLSPADSADIVINEILYRRKQADSEEFIELYNRSSKNVDLSSWSLSDATGSSKIPAGTQLRAGSYLVLADKKELADQEDQVIYLSGFPSLNDDEDAVVVKNGDDQVIDSLFYNESWADPDNGVSIERKDPESASNDGSNWSVSTSETGNSRGIQSTVFHPDDTPPELIFAKLRHSGDIYVTFSEFVKPRQTIARVNGEKVSVTTYVPANGNILLLGGGPYSDAEPLIVTFDQLSDYRGNQSDELSVEVSQPLTPGAVVINEILYDPLANSDDNLPDQTEYVEFYNRSETAISLEGIFIHDAPDESDNIRSIFPVTTTYKWIPSGGYVLLYAEDQFASFSESRMAQYFELQNTGDAFTLRADRSNLSLGSSGDALYLADSSGTIIDSVFYDESWQNPNLYDHAGVALERIDPDSPSNDESNWSSSTQVSGGTPGEQNSIFQQAGAVPDDNGISFTPNPFSPDDDGFEDNLFINYTLDEPDYLLRIRIFDRYGRLVRELADGTQSGIEGSLIWNGLKDDGSKNRVGIYIVLFEAYNSAEGKNKTFKKTVVLARKF